MLGFHFIVTIAASYFLSVSSQAAPECWETLEQTCDYSVFPEEVPTTVDQLRNVCSNIKELGACILRVREGCDDEREAAEKFREILSYIHGVCREDSEVFQAISNNLECIAAASENVFHSCRVFKFSDATKELIMEVLSEYAKKMESGNGGNEASCLDSLWEASCPSIQVGISCGFEVGVAIKDILMNVNDNPMCTEEFIAEISPMLNIVEAAIIQEVLLNKMEEEGEESPSAETRRKRRFASPFPFASSLRERFY